MRVATHRVLLLAAALVLAACSSSGGDSGAAADRTHPPRSAQPSRERALSGGATQQMETGPSTRQANPSLPRSVPATHPAPPPPPVGAGLTVVLNPGHNGADYAHPEEINRLVPMGYGGMKPCDTTGTETGSGYPEHAFNWDVAQRVRRILVSRGVNVIMTRHSDSGVGPCVDQRAAIGNRPDVDAVVSIHADGAPASGHGFHVNQDSRRPDGATVRVARQSIQLGRAIHATLARSSGLVPSTYIGTNGYYYRDDLAGLNLARRPATFLELGNMKNAGDAALQTSPAGRQRIAAAVAAGILAFLSPA